MEEQQIAEFRPPLFRADCGEYDREKEKVVGFLLENEGSAGEYLIQQYVDTSFYTAEGYTEYDGYYETVSFVEDTLEISFDGGDTWFSYTELQKQFNKKDVA